VKKIAAGQRRLLAECCANIGVAWFAGGVIGIFVNKLALFGDIILSLAWGLGFGTAFIATGVWIVKGIK